ncbi:polyprenyl synthetase family protein [Streptomyces sp. NPDC001941]|uniref:polyprenyl synthetase family protein n=1 Tax=Streptomyces sp. NPDC001941 TaxID=3154659 RepID=UPI003332687F
MTSTATPQTPDAPSQFDDHLRQYLATKEYASPTLRHAVQSIGAFVLNGGKRIRPRLCCLGYSAATGEEPTPAVQRCAAAIELFHAFALIHDDIMDSSDSRRGRPTLHHVLATRHDISGTDAHDGLSKAILAGDFALVWADELYHHSGIDDAQRAAAQPLWDALRSEVIAGQYLDVDATGRLDSDLEAAMLVIQYKTAKYTVEQPLLLGAALAGATARQTHTLSAFGLPLGEAFQLRDDLLGVFGTPAVTGKSRLDDLREGKRTPLIALAMRDAQPPQRARLRALLGNPDITEDEAEEVRDILTLCGARHAVEEMIDVRRERALDALAEDHDLHEPATTQLRQLIEQTTRRTL